LNGVSYLAAIAALLSIRPERPPQSQPHATFTFREVLGGLHYLWGESRIRALFLLVSVFGIVGMGYEAMTPAYTRRVVQTDVEGYSLLLACGGVGATLGAFVVAWLYKSRRKEQGAIAGMIVFAGFLAAAALLPLWTRPFGPAPAQLRLPIAAVCLLGAGFGGAVFYSSAMTTIQLAVPDHLRGRVMGIWMIVFSGSVPLGALWTGRAALSFGVGPIMVLSAIVCIVVGLVVLASGVLNPHPDHEPAALCDSTAGSVPEAKVLLEPPPEGKASRIAATGSVPRAAEQPPR
jgi:MFS family permease